jgi:hypothetical protein
MLTILAFILLAVTIGYVYRERLCQKVPNAGWDDFKTYMGQFIANSIIVGLLLLLVVLIISVCGAFKYKTSEFDCKLIMVNNSFLTVTADRYGDVRYAYVFTDGKSINTGVTKVFTTIPEGAEPFVHFTTYKNYMGSWGFPLVGSDALTSEICIPPSLLNNINRNVEQTNDNGGK